MVVCLFNAFLLFQKTFKAASLILRHFLSASICFFFLSASAGFKIASNSLFNRSIRLSIISHFFPFSAFGYFPHNFPNYIFVYFLLCPINYSGLPNRSYSPSIYRDTNTILPQRQQPTRKTRLRFEILLSKPRLTPVLIRSFFNPPLSSPFSQRLP